jgi:hypothetical protein
VGVLGACAGRTAVRIPRTLRHVRVRLAGRRLKVVRRAGQRVVVIRLAGQRQTVIIRGRRPSGRRVVRRRHVAACSLPSSP